MSKTPLEDFYPYVLPFAQSAPDSVIDQYLVMAATEFCERTRSWRVVQDIDIVGDEDEVVFVPAESSLYEIENAWFLPTGSNQWSRPLSRVPFTTIDPTKLPGSGLIDIGDMPEVISQVNDGSVIVAPPAAGTLKVSAFLTPSKQAKNLPRYLFDSFAQTIADGALAQMLIIPGQPYTQPQLAAVKSSTFNAACDRYSFRNIRGQQRAAPRVRSSFV